jgi:heme oxygenase
MLSDLVDPVRCEADFRGTARHRLRVETHAAHAALDQRIAPATIGRRSMYAEYLLGFLPCISIELGLVEAGVSRFLPDWLQRQRCEALMHDLAALSVPQCQQPSSVVESDIGSIMGWSYVLEGSRLGARLILRSVEKSEDPIVRSATRFLRHGEGENLWASFQSALSQIDGDVLAISRACLAANAAFDCFLNAFSTSAPIASHLQ